MPRQEPGGDGLRPFLQIESAALSGDRRGVADWPQAADDLITSATTRVYSFAAALAFWTYSFLRPALDMWQDA